MRELLDKLFSSDFMPHGYCYLWKPGLVWLHVISDALIALAYFSIPVTLIYFIRKRRDLPFNWMFVSFGIFILACGGTHAMEIWTLWHGTYWFSGAVKAVTAMASLPTAMLLVELVPRMLALPSPTALRLEIVERKRVEEALHRANSELELKVLERTAELRKSEAELRTIVETIPAYVWTTLPDGMVDFVCQSWLDYTGLSKEQWLGWGWMTVTHPEDLERTVEKSRAALAAGEPIEQEQRVRQADGSYRWFLGRNVPLRDEHGNILKWYGTLHDIEGQKQAEAALRESELAKRNADLAAASERLRSEQIRRASAEKTARLARDVHDTVAQGFTGIVLNLEAAEEAAADLPEGVRNRIIRARDVARQNLEEVRRSVRMLSVSPAVRGDLAGAIGKSVERIQSNTRVQVGFSVRGTPELLNTTCEENLLRIAQQAIDNALQHAQASRIWVELAFLQKDVRLHIEDNGRGFLTSNLSRHGMGITSMRERAGEIGGNCELKSQLGKGTSVTVKVRRPSTGCPTGSS